MSLVVAALLWAVVGADEYVGANMPQYGLVGGADYVLPTGDDYHASVPAAPHAVPDYKYHEDTSGNVDIPTNDIDTETWKKPPRKQRDGSRRQRNEVGAEAESMGEPLGKAKGSRRRGRARALDEGVRGARRARARALDAEASPPLIDYEEKSTFRKNKVIEDEDRFRDRRETTERIIRRKPRDRYVRPLKSDELDFEEELETDKKLKDVVPNEYSDPGRRDWNRDMPQATRPRGGSLDLVPLPPEHDEEVARARGVGSRRGSDVTLLGMEDDEELHERLRGEATPLPLPPPPPHAGEDRAPRSRTRHYDYGDNYYDMKRVMNIKNKLPSLMRRPTTRARGPPSPPKAFQPARSPPSGGPGERTEAPPWLQQPARSSPGGGSGGAGASELFELLYPARRAGVPFPVSAPAATPTLPSTTSPAPPASTTPARTTPHVAAAAEPSSELTLLERSRLSILKKAQKKEGWGAREASRKPPVLLQVTRKVPTVVMVEPPTSASPWMRARPAAAHSSHQLDKVKRLMRRKLIANARSIQDLTDNWDDMVCDYIDTSLLDEEPSSRATPRTSPALLAARSLWYYSFLADFLLLHDVVLCSLILLFYSDIL